MMREDLQQELDRFQEAALAFLRDPGVITGIEFDGRAGRLMQACARQIQDHRLVSRLFALQKLIREVDVDGARGLYEEVLVHMSVQGLKPRPS
ncbi:MAG: hypothetical protein PVF91_04615 [Chromatiales bacterium]|jgi:hypothetical protein